jgi:hypothetical protein
MSQFPPRVRPSSSRSSDQNVKLKARPDDHYGSPSYQGQGVQYDESGNPVYSDAYQEIQKIKRLSFWSNSDPEPDGEGDWEERQSPSTFILAIVILVVAVTLSWFMFRWLSGGNTGVPPVIQADTTPFKVRPDNPGGMMIPHQDKLVYGRLSPDSSPPVERLLPPPEQLMAEPQYPDQRQAQPYGPPPPAYPPPSQYPQGSGYPPPGQEGYPTYPAMQGPPQQMMPPPSGAHPDYPYGIPPQAQPPYPGQPPYQQAPVPQMPVEGNAPEGNRYPPKKAVSAIEPIKPASDEDDDEEVGFQEGQRELNDLIARESRTPLPKAPEKTIPLKLTPLDPARVKVQIASLPSRAMAEKEMRRLKDNYRHLFGNRPWDIQKINLGQNRGTTYRLVVGAFNNRGNAVKFCSKLRTEGVGCMVVAPAGG